MANVCLIVIDGWGISKETHGNAIHAADTKVMDGLSQLEGQVSRLLFLKMGADQ